MSTKKSAVDVAADRAAQAADKIKQENLKKARIARLKYNLEIVELGFTEHAVIDIGPHGIVPRLSLVDLPVQRQQEVKDNISRDLAALSGIVVPPSSAGLIGQDGSPIA